SVGVKVSEIVYDGYYYVSDATGNDGDGTYYDIEVTADADNPYKITAKLRQKETVLIEDSGLDYQYDNDKKVLTATYNGGTTDTTDDDIIIDIAFDRDNIGKWTQDTGYKKYYYNSILKAGQTTDDLITSVTLNKGVTKDAFLAMDYNLKVTIDSVQVSDDEAKTTAVNAAGWSRKAAVSNNVVTWTTP
ncbi:MAG: hypothetical protein II931_05740, partial [Clostridia bacterium]|nr:hypothetical protein [Clostridia bacterium]